MGNLTEHAQRELEILLKSSKNVFLVRDFIPEILALIEKFGESGQSGASAPYTANAIINTLEKLLMFEPLSPLTGEDSEWREVGGFDSISYQNIRDSSLFKNSDGCSYVNAVIFHEENGMSFTGQAFLDRQRSIRSMLPIREFPFKPETFHLNVYTNEGDHFLVAGQAGILEKIQELYFLPL